MKKHNGHKVDNISKFIFFLCAPCVFFVFFVVW
jgi:hypothetical protein